MNGEGFPCKVCLERLADHSLDYKDTRKVKRFKCEAWYAESGILTNCSRHNDEIVAQFRHYGDVVMFNQIAP